MVSFWLKKDWILSSPLYLYSFLENIPFESILDLYSFLRKLKVLVWNIPNMYGFLRNILIGNIPDLYNFLRNILLEASLICMIFLGISSLRVSRICMIFFRTSPVHPRFVSVYLAKLDFLLHSFNWILFSPRSMDFLLLILQFPLEAFQFFYIGLHSTLLLGSTEQGAHDGAQGNLPHLFGWKSLRPYSDRL